MVIDDPIDAGSGTVTLRPATTTARAIDLGGGTTANALGLSDAELDHVTAGALVIGRTDNPGDLRVTAPVTAHAGYSTLVLLSGGAIGATGTGAIDPTNLALQAANGIGTSANPLPTVASHLVAQTVTGGIFIS